MYTERILDILGINYIFVLTQKVKGNLWVLIIYFMYTKSKRESMGIIC